MSTHKRIVLARRPVGAPVEGDLRLESVESPRPAEGELLLETLYLSLDPYMRGRMGDEASYVAPIPLGGVIVGRTISRVVESRNDNFAPGEIVQATSGWQQVAVSDGTGLRKLDPAIARPTLSLGVLGNSGFAAYIGLIELAQVKAGETVAVAAATGPVGATVVQLARMRGARVIAIAGGVEKTAYARDVLAADVALNHRAPDFPAQLAAASPGGIDVYFENVGGDVLFEVVKQLNPLARVPVCGLIAWYNLASPPVGTDRAPALMRTIVRKRLRIEGFLLTDWEHRREPFEREMSAWVKDGSISYREDIVDGIENAPSAFMGLLEGRNFGKLIVKVG